MYRSVRGDGKLSDMLSWAKDAAVGAALRDLAWDAANGPAKPSGGNQQRPVQK